MTAEKDVKLDSPISLQFIGELKSKDITYFEIYRSPIEKKAMKVTLYSADPSVVASCTRHEAILNLLGLDYLPIIEFDNQPSTATSILPIDLRSALLMLMNRRLFIDILRRLRINDYLIDLLNTFLVRIAPLRVTKIPSVPQKYPPHVTLLNIHVNSVRLQEIWLYRDEYTTDIYEDYVKFVVLHEDRLEGAKLTFFYYKIKDLDLYGESLVNILCALGVPMATALEDLADIERALGKAAVLISSFEKHIVSGFN